MRGPVICAVADSDGANVTRLARDVAERFERPLMCVQVLLSQTTPAREAARPVPAVTSTACGRPPIGLGRAADHLAALAAEHEASFLVVSNGPESDRLARHAPCPVIVVSPGSGHSAASRGATLPREADGGIVRFGIERKLRTVD